MSKIRVVLADDHAVLRSGLRLLVNSQFDMEVVGEAGSFPDARQVCRDLKPHVVILDLNMPGGTATKTIETLAADVPDVHVVILTMHDDPAYMRAAMAAGAHGFVLKKSADTDLLSAVRAAAQGRIFIHADVVRSASASPVTSLDHLSEREREVLKAVAFGYTNQEIADRIDISVKTVESYRARLMTKLQCQTRAELTRCALEAGLLRPGEYPFYGK